MRGLAPVCRRLTAAVVLLCALVAAARADGVAVAPIRIDLAAAAKAEVLTVSNRGSEPAEVQVRVLRWSQDGNDDRHVPSDEVLVSPPRFDLAAGAEQVVRVYRRIAPPRTEQSYRVFIDQLPQGETVPGSVRLPIRLVIPLFVGGTQESGPDLRWSAQRRGEGIVLRVDNRGDRHVRIAGLALAAPAAVAPAPQPTLLYVLSGAQREIVLPRPPGLDTATRQLRLVGDSDAGGIDARVDLLGDP